MLSKNSSVSRAERLAQVVVEVRERRRGRAVSSAGCAATATAPAKLSTSASDLRIGQHPPHLPLEHRRILQLALRRQRQQFVVRDAAPQEERQPRRQLEVADRIRPRRRATSAGSGSSRNRNFGLARINRSAFSMPASKPPFLRPAS